MNMLAEEREILERDMERWCAIPPHKLGDDSRTSFNSLEQLNKSYLGSTLLSTRADPWNFNKAMRRAKFQQSKLIWLLWSRHGWRRLMRPLIQFHFWWAKPV